MGYLDTYASQNAVTRARGQSIDGLLDTVAANYPGFEITSPQYPQPSPYNLAQEGYRKNEFVYSLIGKRAKAVSEAPLEFFTDADEKTRKKIDNFPGKDLLTRPNPSCSEVDFWAITQILMDVAGFCAWEIEFSNGGEPIGLWPMRPDWCSFMRGPGQPIRVIRYQPYGLPFVDVPISKVILFQEFDPLYPLLKGLSRTSVAMRMIGVDNRATDFLADFFKSGAVTAGLLTTEQALNDSTASALQKRWMDTHGGSSNWSQIAVLGQGTKYQQIATDFKNMAFGELDGRTEARLCGVFEMPPMLVSAKIGLAASTLANFQQARQAWYEESILAIWRWYAAKMTTQLMVHYNAKPKQVAAFNTKQIKALQEERSAVWKDASDAASKNIITRDEAREKMGFDPIDEEPIFVGVQVSGPPSKLDITDPTGELTDKLLPEDEAEAAPDMLALPPGTPGAQLALPAPQAAAGLLPGPADQGAETETVPEEPAVVAAKSLERKQFRAFAAKRRKEGQAGAVKTFVFRHLPRAEQDALLAEAAGVKAAPAIDELLERARELRELAERALA